MAELRALVEAYRDAQMAHEETWPPQSDKTVRVLLNPANICRCKEAHEAVSKLDPEEWIAVLDEVDRLRAALLHSPKGRE